MAKNLVVNSIRLSETLAWRLVGWTLTLAVPSGVVHAQVATDISRAPTLTNERYSEDWSKLRDPAARTGRWTEPFKYIPLTEDGWAYLTTGIEVRSRYESYSNPNWGAAPDDDYVWNRVMPYVDLHAGPVRFFTQPIYSAIAGTERTPVPADTNGTDMVQAFGELDVAVANNTSLRVSAGRKLVSLGAGRLIDTRYGVNVPLAFDGAQAVLTSPTRQLTALYMEPVENRLGDFDDRTSRQKEVWGLYATQWLSKDKATGFDIYYLGFRDRNAIFDQGAGRELIHSYGIRFFANTETFYWNIEGVVQRGTFADKRVKAWGVGGEVRYRFHNARLRPELALTADVVSGDDDREDGELGTFNPLFPRGKYFASQSPVGPRNIIHFHPSVTVHPRRDLAVSLTAIGYWRESTGDGIYSIPGFLVRSGQNSDARFVGKQFELAASWQATPELSLSASLSTFEPGRFIRETGPSRTANVAGLMATFRF
jgi:hypothetical protein